MLHFFDGKPNLKNLSSILGSFLEGQFGIALSLVTTFKKLNCIGGVTCGHRDISGQSANRCLGRRVLGDSRAQSDAARVSR
jgi:hypothetical protein